jgi:hypothetical protein
VVRILVEVWTFIHEMLSSGVSVYRIVDGFSHRGVSWVSLIHPVEPHDTDIENCLSSFHLRFEPHYCLITVRIFMCPSRSPTKLCGIGGAQ